MWSRKLIKDLVRDFFRSTRRTHNSAQKKRQHRTSLQVEILEKIKGARNLFS
jgi:hypothetical protein